MSFSLATGIKLILPIKTVAYDQRSSVSRLRKISNLCSLIGYPIRIDIKSCKVKQLEYQSEHPIKNFKLFKKSEKYPTNQGSTDQNQMVRSNKIMKVSDQFGPADRVSLTLTLLLIF